MLRLSKPMRTTRSKIPPQVKNLNNWLIPEVAYKIGHLLKTDLKTPIPEPKENPPVPNKTTTGPIITVPISTTTAEVTIKIAGRPVKTKIAAETKTKIVESAILIIKEAAIPIIEEAAIPTTAEATIMITGNPARTTTADQGKKITGGQRTIEDPMIIENQTINLRANLPGPRRLM